MTRPYQASALVVAEMVDPKTRETLYRNRFVIGLSAKDVRVLKDYIGTTELVERSSNIPKFKNFNALLANGEESRFDLLNVVAMAARKISDDLKPESRRSLLAVEESDPRANAAKGWQGLNPSAIPSSNFNSSGS
ncbi:MAG: hypothetical protein Q9M09_05520 [Mariprofundaceae bacterium]|nr:hypothetical protein [Mariprofundaceae bacterium]